MLSVANKPFILNVIMLSVIMLSVTMLNVVAPTRYLANIIGLFLVYFLSTSCSFLFRQQIMIYKIKLVVMREVTLKYDLYSKIQRPVC
jgi:hypothetical protein